MANLVIDVPQELEEQLRQVAKQQGVPVGELVRGALEALLLSQSAVPTRTPARTREERAAYITAAVRKYAGLPGSVDEFLRNKHEDTEREEERWQRRSRQP